MVGVRLLSFTAVVGGVVLVVTFLFCTYNHRTLTKGEQDGIKNNKDRCQDRAVVVGTDQGVR